MGLFDFFSNSSNEHHERVYGNSHHHHHASFTHEAIAGAAGFEAMKAYEDRCRKNGQPVHHSLIKEMLAGFAAAEVDKLFETKGLDYLDREEAKRQAIYQAHSHWERQYK
ncbi:hypothetical protein RI367_003849 [Sorochytrium milnesiophthora]